METIIDEHYQFLLDYFPDDTIFLRYENLLVQLIDIVVEMGVADQVEINEELLMRAVLDYFTDIARLKQFHRIDNTNEQKTYAYGIYWLLKRSPIQIVAPIDEAYIYINEKAAVAILFPKILKECGVDIIDDSERIRKLLHEYLDLLYYNFKYRQFSQHSLELMIEAFFCGCICYHEEKDADAN